jgi:hypothetical protein
MTEEILPDHTRLSASGAERWMECPASIQIAEMFGLEGEESSYAAEGTAAHELASTCLEDGTDAWEHFGETFYEHEVNADMVVAVQVYLDYCRDLMAKFPKATVLIEKRVDNKAFHPDFGGTSDFTLITDTAIYVVDYKHGVGIAKDALGNPQIEYYALGSYLALEADRQEAIQQACVVIVQPRAFHPKGPIRDSWIYHENLMRWGTEKLLPAMEAVDDIGPTLKSGDHCLFCPAKTGCPIMAAMFDAAAKADLADAKNLSDKELGLEYERASLVLKYVKAIKDMSYSRAIKGAHIPGGKLVESKVDRVLNEAGVEKAPEQFGDDAYVEKKLKSPAQIEKTCVGGPKFVSEYAHKPKKGGLTFVPLSNRSAAISVEKPEEKFKGIKA